MKLHLNPLERSTKQRNEGKKFSFALLRYNHNITVILEGLLIKPKHV